MPEIKKLKDVDNLQLGRLYEIAEVHPYSVWHKDNSGSYDSTGAIVRRGGSDRLYVVQGSPASNFPIVGHEVHMQDIRLRPLTQKEQEKFNGS